MIEEIFTLLSNLLSGNIYISLIASIGWGIMSILLSPCHLASIPLLIGYINTQRKISLRNTFFISLIFAIGILITIALIGVITASLGRIMGDLGNIGNILVALIYFIIGLYLMDFIKLSWGSSKNVRYIEKKKWIGAITLGFLFGIGLGPCTFAFMAPVLVTVFQVAQTNLIFSILLLLAFSLGHCAVIVAAGTLTKKVQLYLNWSDNSKTISYIKKICGALVIIGGIYLIYSIL